MKPNHPEKIVMRTQFSDGVLARLAMEELRRIPDLSVRLFRGRITPEDSSFELEIGGLDSRVKEFIRWCSARGVPIGPTVSGVA